MITDNDILEVTKFCKSNLDFTYTKDIEDYYTSLPLCVIDTVFSIGVKYESVKNVIQKIVEKLDIKKHHEIKYEFPVKKDQMTTSQFLDFIKNIDYQDLAENFYQNKQRTSTQNGILKAQAVSEFCLVLKKFDVEYFEDIDKVINNIDFEKQILNIKGQSSGISLKYFFMLAGNNDFIKPDRMIIRFLESATNKTFNLEECQEILTKVTAILKKEVPNMNAKLLDNQIWNYQRNNPVYSVENTKPTKTTLSKTQKNDGFIYLNKSLEYQNSTNHLLNKNNKSNFQLLNEVIKRFAEKDAPIFPQLLIIYGDSTKKESLIIDALKENEINYVDIRTTINSEEKLFNELSENNNKILLIRWYYSPTIFNYKSVISMLRNAIGWTEDNIKWNPIEFKNKKIDFKGKIIIETNYENLINKIELINSEILRDSVTFKLYFDEMNY